MSNQNPNTKKDEPDLKSPLALLLEEAYQLGYHKIKDGCLIPLALKSQRYITSERKKAVDDYQTNLEQKHIASAIKVARDEVLDRVEEKATEYYDWGKSLEKEVERPFMAVPLERIKKLRSAL